MRHAAIQGHETEKDSTWCCPYPKTTLASRGEAGEITFRTERRAVAQVGGHLFRHERRPDRATRPETTEEVRARLLRMRTHEGMVV